MSQGTNFKLTSPAFADGDMIPDKYTCRGLDVSPPLDIRGVPEEAISLVLVLHDPDALHGHFLHWAVWNLNPDLRSLDEGQLPDNASQGANGYGKVQYSGPCPPPNSTHRYLFDLYALDVELDLPQGAPWEDLEEAIADHQIAQATLSGTFGEP